MSHQLTPLKTVKDCRALKGMSIILTSYNICFFSGSVYEFINIKRTRPAYPQSINFYNGAHASCHCRLKKNNCVYISIQALQNYHSNIKLWISMHLAEERSNYNSLYITFAKLSSQTVGLCHWSKNVLHYKLGNHGYCLLYTSDAADE